MSSVQPAVNRTATGPKTVGDVMTTAVVTAHLGAPLKEIAIAMARNRINAVPVISEAREVVGVVSASDLIDQFTRRGGRAHRPPWNRRRMGRRTQVATAQTLMSWPAVTVTPDLPIAEAAQLAVAEHLHFMPVVSDGVLVGCVTTADLNKIYARSDESLREDIENRIAGGKLLRDPASLVVDVKEGIVALAGTLDTRNEAQQLIESVDSVPGVVRVRTHFTFREDTGKK